MRGNLGSKNLHMPSSRAVLLLVALDPAVSGRPDRELRCGGHDCACGPLCCPRRSTCHKDPTARCASRLGAPLLPLGIDKRYPSWKAENLRLEHSARLHRYRQLRFAGTDYGGWHYNATGLSPRSVVYSVGLGTDTSWDEAIMAAHGLHVWGFDPTPKAIAYVRNNSRLGDRFHFTPEGLAAREGKLTFTLPTNPEHVSMRAGKLSGMGGAVEVRVNTLENWMARNGHTRLDLLKIDIEGSEYDVLDDWIARRAFPMDQLLIEFHQRFLPPALKRRHRRVLDELASSGWDLLHSAADQELLFQRRELGDPQRAKWPPKQASLRRVVGCDKNR